ncbi:MAG TPA: DNA-binding response regulator [Leptospiraceae bacterium]|nr:DNA-binding response regulator [Spirochaetaceae bacterium]HBS07180.1 DNA-binding response regulator [Leptospiraceae bacterium]
MVNSRRNIFSGPEQSIEPCTVVHVDDHSLIRAGIDRLLESVPGVQMVGSFGGTDFLKELKDLKCDIVLMDLSMSDVDGIRLLEILAADRPDIKPIVLTMYLDREYIRAAVGKGARGYILKDDLLDTVVEAIRRVHSGEKYYSTSVQEAMIGEFETRHNRGHSLHLLSQREQEILRMIAKGMKNREVAAELILSVRTVEHHRSRIMHKLKIDGVQGLTRYAVENGLI